MCFIFSSFYFEKPLQTCYNMAEQNLVVANSSSESRPTIRKQKVITTLQIATNPNFKNQASAEKDLYSSAMGYGVIANILKDTLTAIATPEELKEYQRQSLCIKRVEEHLDSIDDGSTERYGIPSKMCIDMKLYQKPGSENVHTIHQIIGDIIFKISQSKS